MDWLAVALFAGLAILFAIAVGTSAAQRRELDEIRQITEGFGEPADNAAAGTRRLRDRAEAAGYEAAQLRRDSAALADLISVGVVHVDDAGRVDLANAAAHAFLDRAPNSIVGKTTIEAFVDRGVEAIVAEARSQGGASGDAIVKAADGRTLTIRARRSPVRGVWIAVEDVSELRRLQQIRAEFIDNLSHELRTPLTTLGLLAETLSREADQAGDAIPARMRDRIGKIEVETGHLVQMATELLDLSRIESGAAVVHLDDVELGRLARTSADRLRLFAERQGATLRVEVEEGLPPVRGDEARLGQVFVNLLHNAVKFSPNGGDVVVRARRAEGEVIASVEDHGVGIPRASIGRVFERFYKVDRARVRGGGTGLGLAIARHVVEQHGGRIWVESEEGRGSTFSFAIPVADGRAA